MCSLDPTSAGRIGLSPSQYDELVKVFGRFTNVESVIVYGSRAKGNYSSRSDLDIAVSLKSPNRHAIAEIWLALEESNLVPSVDIQELSEITNPMLRDHIERRGIELKSQR